MDQLATPATRLTFARVQAGYEDAVGFAREHGIPQSTYALHEKGSRGIRPDVAEKYASLLKNCSAEWILYGKGPSPRHDGSGTPDQPQIGGEAEEMAAFMLLYDRVSVMAKDYEQAMKQEFGFIPRLFGFHATERGVVQIAFHLWRQVVNQKSNLALAERVLERLGFLEASMRQLGETLRSIGGAAKDVPPG